MRKTKKAYADYLAKGVEIIDPLTTYIAAGVKIGKGTTLKDAVVIGNFVEVNRSLIAKASKAKHLTYLGDAVVGEKVNIGAGTIIANFDGKNKHKTIIQQGAFIGSGAILIAPLKVGRQSVVGAGAVVTKNKDVPDKTVVVGVPARPLKKI